MKVLIGGDISIADSAELFAKGDAQGAFNDIINEFARVDEVIVNFECTITEKQEGIKKFGPCLKGPFGTGLTLKKAGVTVCSLSNNHIFDYGIKGVTDTLAEFARYGLKWTGFGNDSVDARRDMLLTDGKVKIAVVAVCEHEYSYALPDRMGAREYDPYDTNEDIAEAKKTADYVIVLYHGGKEHCKYPSPRLRKLCRSMVKHGADVVLCQHSHCIGCYEKFDGAHILYGQGNFHFIKNEYSKELPAWNSGFLVELSFDQSCAIKFIPVVTDGLGMRLANKKEYEDIMQAFEKRNVQLENGEWIQGWRDFVQWVSSSYQFIPSEVANKFGHYLDCEAHTDVWRELYKTWNHSNEK